MSKLTNDHKNNSNVIKYVNFDRSYTSSDTNIDDLHQCRSKMMTSTEIINENIFENSCYKFWSVYVKFIVSQFGEHEIHQLCLILYIIRHEHQWFASMSIDFVRIHDKHNQNMFENPYHKFWVDFAISVDSQFGIHEIHQLWSFLTNIRQLLMLSFSLTLTSKSVKSSLKIHVTNFGPFDGNSWCPNLGNMKFINFDRKWMTSSTHQQSSFSLTSTSKSVKICLKIHVTNFGPFDGNSWCPNLGLMIFVDEIFGTPNFHKLHPTTTHYQYINVNFIAHLWFPNKIHRSSAWH